MKKILIGTVAICFASLVFAQQNVLNDFNIERQNISKQGLTVLSSYAAANIIYGSIAASKADGSNKYFHEMNAIWNGITLGITGIGYLASKKEGILSYNESVRKQHNIEKIFLFNAALDVAYIAGGAYVEERSKNTIKNPVRLKGYGKSIKLQGVLLLLFDGIMFTIHNQHGKKVYNFIDKTKIVATENGVGVVVKL